VEGNIPDFRWLNGKSLKDALEALGRCSEGWEVAESNRGGIRLQSRGVQDQQALREFRLALEKGELLVKDEEGRTVPPEYWRPDGWWFWDGRLWSIKNNVRTVDYVAPYLVVPAAPEGPDPPTYPAKSLSNTAQPNEQTAPTAHWANKDKMPAQTPPQSGAASSTDRPGPKPGVSGKQRTLDLAAELLADEKTRPAAGQGFQRSLAKLISERMAADGFKYKLNSITRTLREFEIRHPEETG
jgi:hypothetical protein